MREKFEKLPEIANKLHHVQWNDKYQMYHAKVYLDAAGEVLNNIRYVSGAWYAFQEQQKIIDAYKLILKTQIGFDIANDVFECSKAPENQNILADCHKGVISKGEFLVNGQNSDSDQSKEVSINIGKDGKITKTGD